MKKILLILISSLTLIVFISCGKNETNIIKTPNQEIFNTNIKYETRYRNPYETHIDTNTSRVPLGESVQFIAVPRNRIGSEGGTYTPLSYKWTDKDKNILSTDANFTYTPLEIGSFYIKLAIEYQGPKNIYSQNTSTIIAVVGEIRAEALRIYKTGQTMCYDYDTYKEEECTIKHRGQDGYYQAGLAKNFSRSNAIVTDNATGYMWADNIDTKNLKMNFNEAKDYCNNLSLGGFTDWRLPTKEELYLLTDYGNFYPATNNIFQNTASYYYWSYDLWTFSYRNDYQWVLFTGYGIRGGIKHTFDLNTRCIR